MKHMRTKSSYVQPFSVHLNFKKPESEPLMFSNITYFLFEIQECEGNNSILLFGVL
jgi:hypothetical protein